MLASSSALGWVSSLSSFSSSFFLFFSYHHTILVFCESWGHPVLGEKANLPVHPAKKNKRLQQLNEVCIIITVSGKKDKTREYSLSSSTALLVVCRHANNGGGGESTIYHSSPGVDLPRGRSTM